MSASQGFKHQGDILKRLIKEKRYSQKKFAKEMGVSRASIQIYLKEQELREDIISKAAQILQVSHSDFFVPESIQKGVSQEVDYLKKINEMLEKEVKRLEEELSKYKIDENRQTG